MTVQVAGHVPGLWEGALLVARRELRDQLRDWRILTPIIILTLFFPVLMNFTARQAVKFVNQYGASIIGERLIPFLLMVVGFFPISISLVIALESFAGERERLSIEPLLATPLTDAQLYLGKVLASLLTPLVAAYLGIGVYLFALYLRLGWSPDPRLLAQVLLLTAVQAAVMVSAAVVISSQTTSVRAANLLASFIIVPMSQLIIGESLIMFWGRYGVLWWIVLGLALVAGLLARMGLRLFNREELLGREIDVLDIRWVARTFGEAFRGGARTPWAWYRGLLVESLPRMRGALLVMAVALAAGYLMGWRMAKVFTLPAEVFQMEHFEGTLLEDLASFGLLSTAGWLRILSNNVRALALASLLGVFSFGVMAVILLMAPLGIVGYFAGNVAAAGLSASRFLVALVLPHALLEVPAALLAGAAILRLGLAVVSPPGGRSLGEAWLGALAEWARVGLGLVVPLLVLAAAVEVFLTPHVAVWLLAGG